MKKLLLTNIILLSLLISCEKRSNYEKLADGVIINLNSNETKRIQVRVIADNIIHVVASPTDSLLKTKSLMILDSLPGTTAWKLIEGDKEVSLQTALLRANISLVTGEVSFTDTTGNVILQEQKHGGKSYIEKQVGNKSAYGIRQVFESPDDEAFYGLGAHQNGQMNYKGQDVELVQQNIVDVVPFIYSNKNYGILWDNYSIGKFGDPRDYQPLKTLQLFTKDGKEGGLTADYYVGDEIIKTATEDNIEYEYLETPQVDNFPKDVAAKGKVVWEGSFSAAAEGNHKFQVYSSGYTKVWIDGNLIFDKWRQGWNPWTNKFNVAVKKDEKHTIKIEWIPDGGAYIAMRHLDPFPQAEQNKLSMTFEVGDEINYYFIKGNSADDVIAGYRELTGKAPIVPKWALGFWQSRERYKSQQEIVDVVKAYRKQRVPLDNVVLDWQYWEDPSWGSHEFDHKRFPNPKAMVDELHNDLHANLMISVWPKFNKGTSNYDEMQRAGFLFTRNIEKKRKDWVGIGYESTFYNPFNEKAGRIFWRQIDEKLNVMGLDAWWLDATEPDIHSNLSIDARKENMNSAEPGLGDRYFNAYSLVNSKSVYEGQRKSSPDKRVFILTRSAYAGQQRYGAITWSGDIVSRWSDFKDQIAAGVNFSLSGIPYWTMDIGGFAVEKRYEHATGETLNEWRELNTRWFQFGVFVPIFRSHGQFPYREIYNIAPEKSDAYNTLVYYDKLRYRLMPYIYSLAGQSYFNNYTIMRGLVMDFNADKNVHNIADQYMFGPSLLINPVSEYKATSRKVYLPASTGWYDFYTGKYFNGGQTLDVDAPLNKIPVFVKEGSIIPAGPEIQYATEKKADPLTLYVFTGANAHFELYEDEDVNYNYEQNQYTSIPFDYNEATHTLTIGARQGSYKAMLEERNFHIVLVSSSHPVGVGLTAPPDQVIRYTGQSTTINLNH